MKKMETVKPDTPAQSSSNQVNRLVNEEVGSLFKYLFYMAMFSSISTILIKISIEHGYLSRASKDCLILVVWGIPLILVGYYTLKSSIHPRIKCLSILVFSVAIFNFILDATDEIDALDEVFLFGRHALLHDASHHILTVMVISIFFYLNYFCIISLIQASNKLDENQHLIQKETLKKESVQKSLNETESRLQTIFNTAEDSIFIKDRQGKYISVNPAMAKLIDKPTSYFTGKSPREIKEYQVNYDEINAGDEYVFQGNRHDKEYKVTILGKDKIIHMIKNPIIEKDGSISGLCCIVRDITQKKENERKQRELENQTQQAKKLESLGVISGGIAHDFNNILIGILCNTNLIQMEENLPESCNSYLADIVSSAEKASDFCNQLLTYSGKGRFIFEPTNLNETICETLKLIKKVISPNVTLVTHLKSDLPNINSNSAQIQQVIMNLVTNASDSLADNEGTINITTGKLDASKEYLASSYLPDHLPAGEYLYIEVQDTGCGMNKEVVAQLFDPFFTTKFTGRGLGMTSALGIVRSHHGTIFVESEPGKGTLFRILFPVTHQPLHKKTVKKKNYHFEASPGTILVIDDEKSVLNVTKKALEMENFTVLTALDGQIGLDVISKHHEEISLILLDLTMPNLNGKEFIDHLKSIHTNIPIILSSGYDAKNVMTKETIQNITGFLKKPYTVQQLLSEIYLGLNSVSSSNVDNQLQKFL